VLSRKVVSPLRPANGKQGTFSLSLLSHWLLFSRLQLMMVALGRVPNLEGRANSVEEVQNPPEGVKLHRDIKLGSRAVLYPIFRPSLTKAKVGMIWILAVEGKVQGV